MNSSGLPFREMQSQYKFPRHETKLGSNFVGLKIDVLPVVAPVNKRTFVYGGYRTQVFKRSKIGLQLCKE